PRVLPTPSGPPGRSPRRGPRPRPRGPPRAPRGRPRACPGRGGGGSRARRCRRPRVRRSLGSRRPGGPSRRHRRVPAGTRRRARHAERDAAGYELPGSVVAGADELAGAAELVRGKLDGVPAAVVRGFGLGGGGTARELVMPPERDLFR